MNSVKKFGGLGVWVMSYRTPFEEALADISLAFKKRRERSAAAMAKLDSIDLSKRAGTVDELLAKADALREAMRERLDADLESFAEIAKHQERALASFDDFKRWMDHNNIIGAPRGADSEIDALSQTLFNRRQSR